MDIVWNSHQIKILKNIHNTFLERALKNHDKNEGLSKTGPSIKEGLQKRHGIFSKHFRLF